ncbi:MipA/OmpV family protein [Motilimonas pumila]|uniref:MipA/OmpV family protein n=1 Tax=Motilimonas pumila TaxID=2303987 RepID=A0A418YJY1_9GAMM|nr:MipA/OmpV family protein [Motilimonas pumila]
MRFFCQGFFTVKLVIALLLLSIAGAAQARVDYADEQNDWGVAMGLRSADIPFNSNEDTVNDVMPLLFYQGEHVYLDGLSGGVNLYQQDGFFAGLMGRFRFFDIDKDAQNDIQGFSLDAGGVVGWQFDSGWQTQVEVLSDSDGRVHGNWLSKYHLTGDSWDFSPYAKLRFKSSRFNNRYYGLTLDDIGADYDITLGAKGRYQLYKNLYALGHVGITRLGRDTYHSDFINSPTQVETYIGLGLFNDPSHKYSGALANDAYVRLAHGWATPSNMGDIFKFNTEKDPYNNTMWSLFYGHPLADNLFDWPFDVYLTPGLIHHNKSDVQDRFMEYVVAIKAYYTFTWPVRWRLGAAEGLSYSSKISYIEQSEMDRKDYKASKLLNYLDISLDVNIGDIVNQANLKGLWLGYSLHHRSGIFTSSSAFGRIKGGSNYNSLYLQWHF